MKYFIIIYKRSIVVVTKRECDNSRNSQLYSNKMNDLYHFLINLLQQRQSFRKHSPLQNDTILFLYEGQEIDYH